MDKADWNDNVFYVAFFLQIIKIITFSKGLIINKIKRFSWVFAIVFLLGCIDSVLAIATDDQTTSEAAPTDVGYSLNWDYVYNVNGSSGVAVDHYWILTASHVADDSTADLEIDGVDYLQQEKVYHPTADLALIRYDLPLPGYYLLNEDKIYYQDSSNKGHPRTVYDELLMVGYGYPGTVSSDGFTQTSSGAGTKRWGTNQGAADSSQTVDIDSGTAVDNKTTQLFYMAFDYEATTYEAGGNIYDSGSPVFIENDGVWKVTGINLYRNGTDLYSGNWAAFIPDYVEWIKSVVTDYDTDMDQLPDWWETMYFPDSGSTASTNSDDDDQNDLYEFYAGTDPTNSASFFELQSAVTNIDETSSFSLIFPGITNRVYSIEESQTLESDSWSVLTNLTVETEGELEFLDPISTALNFYRVEIELYQ